MIVIKRLCGCIVPDRRHSEGRCIRMFAMSKPISVIVGAVVYEFLPCSNRSAIVVMDTALNTV